MTAPPCVLCLSGLDPSGGAGIAADIQACAGSGVHALPLITVLTAQDSTNAAACWPVAQDVLEAQWDLLLADLRPSVVKIGLLGDAAQVRWLAPRLRALGRPVVLDPVLRAGGGRELVDSALREALCEALLPTVDWLLPNAAEARRLSDCADLDAAAAALLARGVRNLLISGGDEPGDVVTDVWYRADTPPHRYTRPRLPGGFHGAGCTLAANLAARLARGEDDTIAVQQALQLTERALAGSFTPGRGRAFPHRLCKTP